jgi:predicted nucleic acid-binding protein
MIVIDASLAVKWFADEDHSEAADSVLANNPSNIVVPEVFLGEVVGALVRRANVDRSLRRESEASIDRFVMLMSGQWIRTEHTDPHAMSRAANLALDLGHPLKDCIYLALAMELGCDLVTCDAKFAAKAKGVWAGVRVLGE